MKKDQSQLTQEIKKIWKPNKYDPNGSYIGNSKDDEPVQDQDDL